MNKQYYSSTELQEFKTIIQSKLQQAKEKLEELREDVKGNKNGTDDTGVNFNPFESAQESNLKEELVQLASKQRVFIEQLQKALIRIENKTYGVCRVTGELIPKERLKIVPHATLSVTGKMIEASSINVSSREFI